MTITNVVIDFMRSNADIFSSISLFPSPRVFQLELADPTAIKVRGISFLTDRARTQDLGVGSLFESCTIP